MRRHLTLRRHFTAKKIQDSLIIDGMTKRGKERGMLRQRQGGKDRRNA